MKILFLIMISFQFSTSTLAKEKKVNGDFCEMLAKIEADSKNLYGEKRKKFILAMKKTCTVEKFSNENYQKDIQLLTESIKILENIKEAEKELKDALELRAMKNTHKTYVNYGYIDTSACWDAIFDYSHLLEFEDKAFLYLNRGKLYYEVEKYKKACSDLLQAKSMGLREAGNLIDKLDCN